VGLRSAWEALGARLGRCLCAPCLFSEVRLRDRELRALCSLGLCVGMRPRPLDLETTMYTTSSTSAVTIFVFRFLIQPADLIYTLYELRYKFFLRSLF
jgi:hypothetical protein